MSRGTSHPALRAGASPQVMGTVLEVSGAETLINTLE
jgi:hypothetical protein